jgi:hypothetical protein
MDSLGIAPPEGFTDVPPPTQALSPPPGYDEAPPPDGFSAQNPLAPPKTTQADEKTNTEVPGFWGAVGSSFGRGLAQRTADDIAGAQTLLPVGIGGKTLEEQYQEGLIKPETKDELDALLGKKVNEGWTDPKWWGAQLAHGTGGMLPAVGAAAVGAVARVPIPVSFGLEGAVGALVPAYKKARAEGLDPDAATSRAIVDSGISAATAAAMGLAPNISLFGKNTAVINDQVAQTLKRPVMELLAQLGMVQPGLAVTGEIVKDLSHGEAPDPWGLATTFVVGAAQGVPIVGAHSAMSAVRTMRSRAVPSEPTASPEQVQRSFENQEPPTAPVRPDEPPPPEGFVANEQEVVPREDRLFFSPVREIIEQKMPSSAPAHEVAGILRGAPGVKAEEINQLQLPAYLADPNKKVNKADLLAHIDANSIRLEEIRYGDVNDPANAGPLEFPQDAYYLPGPDSNRREIVFKVPVDPRLIDSAVVEQKAFDMWNYNFRQEFGPWTHAGEDSRQQMRDKALKFYMDAHPDIFTGSHWKDPNAFGHIRVSDRTGRNGERLLHAHELQSDLHQQGAEVGYLAPGEKRLDTTAAFKKQADIRSRIEVVERLHKNDEDVYVNDPAWLDLVQQWRGATKEVEAAVAQGNKFADFPFKTSWQELMVKRLLQIAADEGYDGVSWSNGDQVGLRLKDERELAGARLNYNKKIPALFAKWAKKMGMDVDTTVLENSRVEDYLDKVPLQARTGRAATLARMGLFADTFDNRNFFVRLNPAAGNRIRQGLPLYETGPEGAGGGITLNQAIQKGNPKAMKPHIEAIQKILGQLGKDMKISRPIEFEIGPKRTNWRGQADRKDGKFIIRINTRLLSKVEDFYATAAHELGHVIMWDKFGKAPDQVKIQVRQAYEEFRKNVSADVRTVGDLRRIRDNPVSEMTEGRNLMTAGRWSDSIPLSDLTPKSRAYVLHFEEWFAEQTAKWATTSEKPLSRVDKFFKELGASVRKLIERFRGERKTPAEAIPELQKWLDSLVNDKGKFANDLLDQLDLDTKRRNADALDRDGTGEVAATPATASTVGGRNIIDALPPGAAGSAGPASAAHADRMNRFYEWMTSLPQIAELNKHIRPLQLYREVVAQMNLEKNVIMSAAAETLKQWKLIRDPVQQISIGKFIEDYMNGHFKLVDDGLIRRPTQAEFTALAAKHKLSGQSLRLFDKLVRDFDGLLESYRSLLLADAFRITDPAAQLKSIETINKRVDTLLQRPYFPAMRFGKYTITVYDSAGNIRHFEQTESLGKQRKIEEALKKSPDLLPGDRVRTGEVPKDAAPLLGMPPGLIDLIADKLSLSTTQRDMLDQLRFDYAPSQSFRHQFRQKDLTPGYSSDFQRAYANFFFHGANHITRVKWVDTLRDQIREVKKGSIDLNDANKRDAIANYLTEHLSMLVDPKPDFAALRGLMFHWYLGFNPASATLNLSQTPLMTYPHLASKFGDIRSVGALMKASSDLNNFYKKGTIQELAKNAVPGPKGAALRALSEAVKEGVISETQAHTLAAVSENRNLLRAFGSKGEEGWHRFSEASSWMFEMAEQYNRRVAFRAAWELAMREPNNKYVQATVRDNPLQYQRLIDQGWSHQEASAFAAGKDSVEKSQFVYAPYARPKFMWGRKGALFIFKSFVQNTLFNLWSNPSMAARHLLILGAVGGLMGLPGVEDVNGILKALAWHLFGKDFDLEDHARKFAVDVLHGNISPDMLLHGTSVKGFGIPHVLNATGAQVGLPKLFPTLDRHGSISMGNILPFEPGKLFGPTKDIKSAELAQLQRASGAGFSNIFALYNFLSSQQNISDLKRWELVMPRFMSNVSHGFRYLSEGQERNRAGNAVVRFDVNDTEHMAEILARTLGYQPRRLTGAWEAIQAKQEQATFWDLRKGILLRQFGEAVKGQNLEDRAQVLEAVKKYNRELPPEARAKAITSQTLKDSVMQRMRVKAQQERGLPTSKQNYELFKSLDQYFPDGRPTGQVDARPVR